MFLLREERDLETNAIILSKTDNVAVALTAIRKGQTVKVVYGKETYCIESAEDIPIYHKLSLREFCPGDKIFKYGEVIGEVTQAIKKGEHVHIHNLKTLRG
jgi:altronate dehydratase small subunit